MKQFECYPKGRRDWAMRIFASTIGKAKSDYHRHISDPYPDYPFTDIRAREVYDYVTPEVFYRMAKYRRIPFAKVGMKVTFKDGDEGVIIGYNHGMNLDVYITKGKRQGHQGNYHPHWEIAYHNESGDVIKSFF